MAASRLTNKGQLVVPKPIRDYMHLHPGDRLDFIIQDDGEVIVRPVVSDVRDLKGMLKQAGRKPVSVGRMNEAIRKRAGENR
jgi:AbrB family looped-hinge helix DNA binding protein